ncbi:MAG: hypothetical protein ACLFSB_15995, partial [Chitinispirillaceae bacterium]
TLGNTYYVIDHLPQDSLPSSIILANSWNMPKNTTQMGATGWERFVFEGTTPDPATSPFNARSRIELAVAGATNVESVFDSSPNYQMKKNQYLATNHITFENDLHGHQFLLTQIRSCDAAANLTLISNQTIDTTVFTGGIVWKREYSNGSIDVIAYNPEKQSQTLESILTSDAEVWLLHADATGSWRTARLYDATFVQYPSVTPTTVNSYDSPGMEVQYDFAFPEIGKIRTEVLDIGGNEGIILPEEITYMDSLPQPYGAIDVNFSGTWTQETFNSLPQWAQQWLGKHNL